MPAGRIAELTTRCREQYLGGAAPTSAEVGELIDLACADETALEASVALFADVVEPLADRFEPRLVDAYVEFFGDVIERCRRRPGFEAFDRRLREFGHAGADDIKTRFESLAEPPRIDRVRRCLVLSRVTAGADVAVTSPIMKGLEARFPGVEILLVGAGKPYGLFAGDGRIRAQPYSYERGGTLRSRLLSWVGLVDELEEALTGDVVVVDPDSRLTQLGLLPLGDDDRYAFFNSRAYSPLSSEPIARLAGQWVAEWLGLDQEPRPFVSLSESRQPEERLATVNWGVGGNESKRVGGDFEIEAVRLLAEAGWRVVLDRGLGEDEAARAQRIADALGSRVQLWSGGLPELAALISASDMYLGYDSAGGHIAAAAGVRGINIFAGAVSERMRERWSPWGRYAGRVIPAETADETLEKLGEQLR